jgi:drug/metabolite transporter (DMT)-like permease
MSFLPMAGAAGIGEAGNVAEQQVVSRPATRPSVSPDVAGWAALLVVWVFWGSTYLAIRIGDQSIPPLVLAAVRYLAAGALLYPFARFRNRADGRPGKAQWAGMTVVGALLLAFGNGGISYAERTLPSGLAALLVASVPLWMALADLVINRHRLRPAGWAAIVIGLAGIAVLAQPHGHGTLIPVIVALAAGLSWGVGSVVAGRLPAPASPLLGSAMEMLTGGAVLVALAGATGEIRPVHPSGGSLLAVAYLIVLGSLLALTCYVVALRRLPVSVVSTYAYVNPVVAVGLGALVLGERLTWSTLIGGVIVVASVALLLAKRTGDSTADNAGDNRR